MRSRACQPASAPIASSARSPRRAQRRPIVAAPLLRHADAHHAHTDNVVDVAVVPQDLHGRKDQRALLVGVAGGGMVGRGDGVADAGLVRLGQHGEAMHALVVDHRDQDRQVGGVGATVIRRIVEKRVAPAEIGVKRRHRAGHRIGPDHDVDRQAFADAQQARVAGQDTARRVAPVVDDARPRGPEQGVLHLGGDALDPLVEHRHALCVHGRTPRRLRSRGLNGHRCSVPQS